MCHIAAFVAGPPNVIHYELLPLPPHARRSNTTASIRTYQAADLILPKAQMALAEVERLLWRAGVKKRLGDQVYHAIVNFRSAPDLKSPNRQSPILSPKKVILNFNPAEFPRSNRFRWFANEKVLLPSRA
ncbi:MAG: hypothetical protein R2873_07975 [Caldilineaceae bacterium]